MICAFSNNPPLPWTVLGVTGQTLFKNLFKCMNFNFVQGGGGNLGIAILTTVNWRSLTNFLPKRGGGKSSVPNPFGQDCSLYTDVVLFFFSFFSKTSASWPAKQARETFPHHYPLALAVIKSPAVYILSPALDGLWRENRRSVNRLNQTLTHCNRVKFRLTCILIYSSPNLVRYIRLLQIKMFFKIKEEAFTVLKSNFEMQIETYLYI